MTNCWICLEEDGIEKTAAIRVCLCTDFPVHEDCLITWMTSNSGHDSCPVCKYKYDYSESSSAILKTGRFIDSILKISVPLISITLICTSGFILSFVFGYYTIDLVCDKDLVSSIFSDITLSRATSVALIPITMLMSQRYDYDLALILLSELIIGPSSFGFPSPSSSPETLLSFLPWAQLIYNFTSRTLKWIILGNIDDPTPHRPNLERRVVGTFLFPYIASSVGELLIRVDSLRKMLPTKLHRSLFGGFVVVVVRDVFSVSWRLYKRTVKRIFRIHPYAPLGITRLD